MSGGGFVIESLERPGQHYSVAAGAAIGVPQGVFEEGVARALRFHRRADAECFAAAFLRSTATRARDDV